MTAKEYRETLLEIHHDIGRTKAVISGLHHAFESLLDFSEDSVKAIIRLVSDDIGLQYDHIGRILGGKYPIRGAAPEALRPPEKWEQIHAEKSINSISEDTP